MIGLLSHAVKNKNKTKGKKFTFLDSKISCSDWPDIKEI